MKLAKCPNCQTPQSFRKIVFLTNFSVKECSSCKTKYQIIKSKIYSSNIVSSHPSTVWTIHSSI